ncbi:hypothetical protein GCM10010211_14680 [Streptomyces albospinus]|uniref:Uncharacterized protein n=1 Tax=Streptomyces albospinus TaxID=285515 RepID=A0ABQ2UW63_9ACTN|nr:hypothetical protein GCM10010211_14680 [Streptomyces albospinus]
MKNFRTFTHRGTCSAATASDAMDNVSDAVHAAPVSAMAMIFRMRSLPLTAPAVPMARPSPPASMPLPPWLSVLLLMENSPNGDGKADYPGPDVDVP